ncbi:MAG: hypothetical protein HYV04_18950 [Deltaproteobacteria bacterium]|nr:hypothetical protein [Deltaproteobacteria bacterium]
MDEEERKLTAGASEAVAKGLLQHFAENYWTPWFYNEAVGWLRIYVYPHWREELTPVLNAEYFFVDAQRIGLKLKRKRFLWQGEAFGIVIPRASTSAEIYTMVHKAVIDWWHRTPISKWTLDTEAFENAGPLLDWRALLRLRSGTRT